MLFGFYTLSVDPKFVIRILDKKKVADMAFLGYTNRIRIGAIVSKTHFVSRFVDLVPDWFQASSASRHQFSVQARDTGSISDHNFPKRIRIRLNIKYRIRIRP